MKRSLEELQKRYARAVSGKAGRPGPGGGRRGGAPGMKGKPKNAKKTIARLLKYIAAYKLELFVVFFCMIVSTLTSLAGSYLMRPVINNVADSSVPAEERIAALFQTLVILAIVYAVGIVTTYLQGRIMLRVSQNAIEKLRGDLFDSLQTLPLRYFDTNTTGEIMSRFTSDIDNIDTMINNTVTSLVSGAITLVGTFALMLYTNVWLTLITVAFVPIFTFGGAAIAKASGKYYAGQQAALGAVNGYIEETVTGSKVVKVFNHESVCEEEFGALNNDLRDKQFKAQFYGSIMGPVMGNTSQISFAVTAGVGGLLCIFKGFDVGGLSTFCGFSRHFAMPINNISQQMTTIFAALAGAERVFGIMDMDPEMADIPDADPMEGMRGDVVFDDVSFGYVPEHTILKHISLYAHPGQKIAFVGSTGAGKTT
ncbi:MAG: ABC transporter ATP-binding protein, partial [Clostridia bacterium]|nr:ABC transporter ATP-binding protein [Clostridia bacterium]